MATTADDMIPPARAEASEAAWRLALPAVLAALAGLIGLYWETVVSIVSIWNRSETFAHGFVVVPITAWLVWRRREAIARVTPRASLGAATLLLLAGVGWLGARLLGLLVIEQLAFVTMIPLVVWAILGWPVIRTVLFPLAFLFFAVPMGEELIPPLMDFTAVFTVMMLRLTGIPVYVEGTFFTIPSGSWSVVEGCSGIRYLIASITLGTLYAYLTYRSYWRRGIFMALSVLVPIFANGMRAYIIVMLAHLSDHRLAHGVDHFIYGWVWFGIVMLLLFWLGSFWRDDEPRSGNHGPTDPAGGAQAAGDPPVPVAHPRSATLPAQYPARRLGVAVLATFAAAALAPGVYALTQQLSRPAAGTVSLTAPAPADGWSADPALLSDWEPRYLGMDAKVHQTYRGGGDAIGLFVAVYGGLAQGEELINSQNILIGQKHPKWRMPLEEPRYVALAGRPTEVLEARLRSDSQSFLVWRWNWVNGTVTVNPIQGKLLEALDKLDGGGRLSAGVVVYTPLEAEPDDERARLQGFVDAMLPAVVASIEAARGR
jgi:exosortase A